MLALPMVCIMLAMTGCQLKPNPVTWDDIARTIPSNPSYVVSVNVDFATDSTLNRIWANDDVIDLLLKGLSLDSVRPSHFVVVSYSDVTYVTWPLPNPRAIAEKVSDWETASLNNTVDAHIYTTRHASLVLSSTQAWVVDNEHGESYVNSLLGAAMDTKAANVPPYASCISSVPKLVEAVLPYNNKYYAVGLNHEEGLLRVDVDAYDKRNRRVNLVEGFGRLPVEFVDSLSTVSPFVAAQVDSGNMPAVIRNVSRMLDSSTASMAAGLVAPYFADARGTVLALWNEDGIDIRVPFTDTDAAMDTESRIKTLVRKTDLHADIYRRNDTLSIKIDRHIDMPKLDKNRRTPHARTQTEQPSAVAFARVDLHRGDPVAAYFELAPTHARLQIDFKEGKANLADVTEFVKELIFKTL